MGLPAGSYLAMPAGETLYRLVRNDKPVEYSFQSRAVRGRGRLPDGHAILHTALSMFPTPEEARARGGLYDSHVARVQLSAGLSIHVAKTLGLGHYSVWGDPKDLMQLAALVEEGT